MTVTLLDGRAVDVDGDRFSVHAQLAFQPQSRIPTWYGVKGPRALDAAAADADGVLLSVLAGPAYIGWVRERVGDGVGLGAFVELSVEDDSVAARNAVRPFVARFLGMHGDQPITRVAGVSAEQARAFRAALVGGTPDVASVTDEILDAVVVAGDISDAAAALARFAASGLDTFIVGDRPDQPPEHVIAAVLAVWSAAGLVAG